MITPQIIYWITRLDSVSVLMTVITILCMIGTSLSIVSLIVAYVEEEGMSCKLMKIRVTSALVVMTVVFALLACLTPTTKEAAAMIVIPRIANSETCDEIGYGLKELVLDWIKELESSKQNGTSK